MPRRILLLSATTGYQLRSFNDAAAQLGVRLTFATDRCHALDDPWQDGAIPVRFHDEEASLELILEAAAVQPFDGLIAVGDRPTLLAARAAAALGLPGNPLDAVRASVSKIESRGRFAAAGLPTPWFRLIDDQETAQVVSTDAGVRYPCVVKPTRLSGSRGVIRANTPDECVAAVDRVRALLARRDVQVLRSPVPQQLIVEGFIPGREYALEGVISSGTLQPFAVFDKPDPLDGPFFEETIYVTPPALDDAVRDAIIDTVGQAIRALGLLHGPVHAECRVGSRGIVMLEVAARPIGGLCSRVLRFVRNDRADDGSRASLEEVLLRHSLGEDVGGWRREPEAAAVMMIPIPRAGRLRLVEGEADALAVDGVEEVRVTAKRGQLLEPLPEAGSYLGFIFARGCSSKAAEAAVRESHQRLTFRVDAPLAVG